MDKIGLRACFFIPDPRIGISPPGVSLNSDGAEAEKTCPKADFVHAGYESLRGSTHFECLTMTVMHMVCKIPKTVQFQVCKIPQTPSFMVCKILVYDAEPSVAKDIARALGVHPAMLYMGL